MESPQIRLDTKSGAALVDFSAAVGTVRKLRDWTLDPVVGDADGVVGAPAAQVVARLRAAPRTRDLPVIVTADEPLRDDARSAAAVLRSPVERSGVAAALANLLELA